MANILKGYRGNKTPLFQEVAGLVSKEDFEAVTSPDTNVSTPTSLGEAWRQKEESKIDPTTIIESGEDRVRSTYDPRLPHGERITPITPTEDISISDEDAAEIARIDAYAKKHKVKGSIYEKKPKGGFLGLGPIIPKHNTQNQKAQARQANKTRRIGVRKNRQKNRQEFLRNIGTGQNIENFRQRKKGGTTKGQKDGSGNQTGEGGCLAGQCTPG